MESSVPITRYAKNGAVHIAYQTLGEGPVDVVYLPGIFTHLEHQWEEPSLARFLRRVAGFSRLIMLDPRGIGLSDRARELPILEQQMDDVLAVLDAVQSPRAVLFGVSQSGPMGILFAATHPERTSGLILYGAYPTQIRDDDFPWQRSHAWWEEWFRQIDEDWGTGSFLPFVAPTRAGDERFRAWWGRLERLAAGPGNALAFAQLQMRTDVRPALSAIRVPTLILQRRDDSFRNPRIARYMAERIDGAKLVELTGVDHLLYVGDADEVVGAIEEFVTGSPGSVPEDRALATLLFTDIVDSTKRAAELGDAEWRELLERHHAVIRHELGRFRGREVDTAGDGFFAMFDGPARAVRCAIAARDAVRELGIEIRAGLHTGEVELSGSRASGLAVHIGARIVALAGGGEVLASSTVRDLVAGSGIEFEPRGEHELKGVPGTWSVFAVRYA